MAQSRKATNKELLLDAAMQVVAKVGLHSFSMRQVTNMCGVSDMLIYRHYQSKDNFLRQCYLRAVGEMKELFKYEKHRDLIHTMSFMIIFMTFGLNTLHI